MRTRRQSVTAEWMMTRVDIDENTGCWNWKGKLTEFGYGRIDINGENRRAHRVAYELWNGPITKGLCVLHLCDNPACCNPAHLAVGTQYENVMDMVRKGRAWRKVSPEQVIQIRALLADKVRHTDIAAQFGITRYIVEEISRGRRWKTNHEMGILRIGR